MNERSPFDMLAETYDEDFTASAIGGLQRKRVWKLLDPFIKQNKILKILEINCGTGEDALYLASMGHEVVATDASAEMIEQAEAKRVAGETRMGKIRFLQCSFKQLAEQFAGKQFDLVFSDFGGINCINKEQVIQLSADLSKLVTPGGMVVLVVLGRFCLWETGYYTMKRKFSEALRRSRKNNYYEVDGYSMPVFYYSPGELKKIFDPYFAHEQNYPVGLMIPPSYLEKQFLKRPGLLNKLGRWEDRWGKYSVFSMLADHFCIIFKKKQP